MSRELSTIRLYSMKFLYLLTRIGLGISVWPDNDTSWKAVGSSPWRCFQLLGSFINPDAFGCAISRENAATDVATTIIQTDMGDRSWLSVVVGRSLGSGSIRALQSLRNRSCFGSYCHSLALCV